MLSTQVTLETLDRALTYIPRVLTKIQNLAELEWETMRYVLFERMADELQLPFRRWPLDMQRDFFAKPFDYSKAFWMMTFYLGNHGEPTLITTWILMSFKEYNTDLLNMSKLLVMILRSILVPRNLGSWHYHDLREGVRSFLLRDNRGKPLRANVIYPLDFMDGFYLKTICRRTKRF